MCIRDRWNTSVCSQRRVHKLKVTLVFVCVHKLRCASHMVITTVMHARLRRVAGVHKYDDGKHHSHFCPLTKVAQYFLGYKRSASTLSMQCSSGQCLAFVQECAHKLTSVCWWRDFSRAMRRRFNGHDYHRTRTFFEVYKHTCEHACLTADIHCVFGSHVSINW